MGILPRIKTYVQATVQLFFTSWEQRMDDEIAKAKQEIMEDYEARIIALEARLPPE